MLEVVDFDCFLRHVETALPKCRMRQTDQCENWRSSSLGTGTFASTMAGFGFRAWVPLELILQRTFLPMPLVVRR